MAHFAEVDNNNIVLRVLVVDNKYEEHGNDFLANDLGLGGRWVQTSYNGSIRKNYAGIGYTYDPINDWFAAPQPYSSWILDENAQWQAPVDYPTDGKLYTWNEQALNWDEVI